MLKRLEIGPIGPDIDLDDEVVRLPSGRRLTPAVADEYIEAARSVGRPSLSGAEESPRISFRVPHDLRVSAELVAQQQGISVSGVARHALEEYVQQNR